MTQSTTSLPAFEDILDDAYVTGVAHTFFGNVVVACLLPHSQMLEITLISTASATKIRRALRAAGLPQRTLSENTIGFMLEHFGLYGAQPVGILNFTLDNRNGNSFLLYAHLDILEQIQRRHGADLTVDELRNLLQSDRRNLLDADDFANYEPRVFMDRVHELFERISVWHLMTDHYFERQTTSLNR